MALSKIFGADEDVMEENSPSLSLKRLLADKAKTQPKGIANGKMTRETTLQYPLLQLPSKDNLPELQPT